MSTAARSNPTLIHLVLALGGFAIGTTEFATMSLLPYLAHDLQISVPVAGHVISAYALGVVVGAPLIAVLSARMPRRTLLVVLMGFYALANGLSAIAPTYAWMLCLRFLTGLPHGAYFGIAMLSAASVVPSGVPPRERGGSGSRSGKSSRVTTGRARPRSRATAFRSSTRD